MIFYSTYINVKLSLLLSEDGRALLRRQIFKMLTTESIQRCSSCCHQIVQRFSGFILDPFLHLKSAANCSRTFLASFFSSVRSSKSHPDLLLTQHHHHPTFPDLACQPLQLYQKQSLDSSAGFMYTLWVQKDITDDDILATF